MRERVNKYQYDQLKTLFKKNKNKIQKINQMSLCYGDKARLIVKQKITDNLVYARKLLEFK